MSPTLPAGVQPYRRTPSFNEETVPAGLRAEHATKVGVWGVIRLESGRLSFQSAGDEDPTILEAPSEQVIAPEVPHWVGIIGPVNFHVEFYR